MSDYKIHTILINKKNDINKACMWIIEHNFKLKKIDDEYNKDYFRFRQLSKDSLKKHGYTNYVTKTIDNNKDIKLVLAYRNNNNTFNYV